LPGKALPSRVWAKVTGSGQYPIESGPQLFYLRVRAYDAFGTVHDAQSKPNRFAVGLVGKGVYGCLGLTENYSCRPPRTEWLGPRRPKSCHSASNSRRKQLLAESRSALTAIASKPRAAAARRSKNQNPVKLPKLESRNQGPKLDASVRRLISVPGQDSDPRCPIITSSDVLFDLFRGTAASQGEQRRGGGGHALQDGSDPRRTEFGFPRIDAEAHFSGKKERRGPASSSLSALTKSKLAAGGFAGSARRVTRRIRGGPSQRRRPGVGGAPLAPWAPRLPLLPREKPCLIYATLPVCRMEWTTSGFFATSAVCSGMGFFAKANRGTPEKLDGALFLRHGLPIEGSNLKRPLCAADRHSLYTGAMILSGFSRTSGWLRDGQLVMTGMAVLARVAFEAPRSMPRGRIHDMDSNAARSCTPWVGFRMRGACGK